MAQTTKFTNLSAYKWLDPSKAPKYGGYSKSQIESWRKRAAAGSSAAQINLNYYTKGTGYQEAITDWAIQQTESYLGKNDLGVTASQLLTNPQLYTDKAALKKYTTVQPEESKTLGSYTIKSGDTLSKIAQANNTTVSALMTANPSIKDPNKIYAGNTLNIPGKVVSKTKVEEEKEEEKGEEKEGVSGETYTVPEWLANNEYFQQLSPDEQEYMVNYYNVLTIQDEENQKILAQALEDAKGQADPYFAEKIRMAQDELTRALGQQAGDFASQKRDLELRIDQLTEDLKTGKERLSIDQQAELGRQQRTYEYQLENLIEGARHKGLTFSTKRALAESRLGVEQKDITESTKREFQRRIGDLQLAASRGEVGAQNLLKDYERTYGENVTTLIRTAEKQLGTKDLPSGLPDLPGVSPLGDVTGSFAEEKQMDILQRAEALANLRNPFI